MKMDSSLDLFTGTSVLYRIRNSMVKLCDEVSNLPITIVHLFKDLFEEYVIENHFNDLMNVMKEEDPEKHYGVEMKYYYFIPTFSFIHLRITFLPTFKRIQRNRFY